MSANTVDRLAPKLGGRIGDAAFVIAFGLLLASGLLFQVAGFSGMKLVEKRTLSAAPSWPSTPGQWERFPGLVDQYVNDNFGLRNELITLNSCLRYVLGVSAVPRVMVGRQGWLFYGPEDTSKYALGITSLSDPEIQEWLDRMEKRREWLAARGIQFVVLPAPLKSTIYPENLPYWLSRQAGKTELDLLLLAAASRPHLVVLDVRPRLLEKKRTVAPYTAFDTHWNAEGAFVAYSAVMEKIDTAKLGVVPLQRSALHIQFAPPARSSYDLSLMLGINRLFPTHWLEYVPQHADSIHVRYITARTDWDCPKLFETGVANKARIMLIRDSFATSMLPYFEDTFGSVVSSHAGEDSFPQALIEQHHPDVVLLEVQERGLRSM